MIPPTTRTAEQKAEEIVKEGLRWTGKYKSDEDIVLNEETLMIVKSVAQALVSVAPDEVKDNK